MCRAHVQITRVPKIPKLGQFRNSLNYEVAGLPQELQVRVSDFRRSGHTAFATNAFAVFGFANSGPPSRAPTCSHRLDGVDGIRNRSTSAPLVPFVVRDFVGCQVTFLLLASRRPDWARILQILEGLENPSGVLELACAGSLVAMSDCISELLFFLAVPELRWPGLANLWLFRPLSGFVFSGRSCKHDFVSSYSFVLREALPELLRAPPLCGHCRVSLDSCDHARSAAARAAAASVAWVGRLRLEVGQARVPLSAVGGCQARGPRLSYLTRVGESPKLSGDAFSTARFSDHGPGDVVSESLLSGLAFGLTWVVGLELSRLSRV